MSNDPSPLKYMGTQSHETVAMGAAMAARAEEAVDRTIEKLADAGRAANASSGIGDAASWAVDKAKDAAQATAHQIRKRTRKAVESYTRDDPVRAILIAAGTGALLMLLVALMARSGARSVARRVGADT
ncbi:MAG: hypothetical protein ACXWJ7_12030 [Caldimonas sp.]